MQSSESSNSKAKWSYLRKPVIGLIALLAVYTIKRIYTGVRDAHRESIKPSVSRSDSVSKRKRKHDNRLDFRQLASNKKKRTAEDLEAAKAKEFSPVLKTTGSKEDSPNTVLSGKLF